MITPIKRRYGRRVKPAQRLSWRVFRQSLQAEASLGERAMHRVVSKRPGSRWACARTVKKRILALVILPLSIPISAFAFSLTMSNTSQPDDSAVIRVTPSDSASSAIGVTCSEALEAAPSSQITTVDFGGVTVLQGIVQCEGGLHEVAKTIDRDGQVIGERKKVA